MLNNFSSEPPWNYSRFEDWYAVFKRAAVETNAQLSIDPNGGSLLDFMDQSPLRRAFLEKVEPKSLARSFAMQFDLSTFGHK